MIPKRSENLSYLMSGFRQGLQTTAMVYILGIYGSLARRSKWGIIFGKKFICSHWICVFEYSFEKANSQQFKFGDVFFDVCWWAWQLQTSWVVCQKIPIVLACTSVFMENRYIISAAIESIFFIFDLEVNFFAISPSLIPGG